MAGHDKLLCPFTPSPLQLRPLVAVLYMTVFCVVSPIGVGVGMALTSPDQEGEMATNALIVLQVAIPTQSIGLHPTTTRPPSDHHPTTSRPPPDHPTYLLQGLATGSLFYVVFFEILEKERQKQVNGLLQVASMAAGYVFMVLLGLAEVRSERAEEVAVKLL